MASGTTAAVSGILLTGFLPHPCPPSWAAAAAAIGVLSYLFTRHRLAAIGVFFSLGVLWGSLYGQYLLSHLLPETQELKELSVRGRIVGLPETVTSDGRPIHRFDMLVDAAGCLPPEPACAPPVRRIRLTRYDGELPLAGERWQFSVRLRRPRGFANPAGFDYGAWLVTNGYHATGYVTRELPARRLQPAGGWQGLRFRLKQYLQRRLESYDQREFLLALLVGDRSGVSPAMWQTYNATGTTHLLAISGLHIGIVAGLGAALGVLPARLLSLAGLGAVNLPLLAGALAAAAYAYLAGFALPTQRALIMTLVGLLAFGLRRRTAPWEFWSAALLGVLLVHPLAGHSAGFWLSFGAVAVLIHALAGRRHRRRDWGVRAQWAVFLGLAPLLAVAVGQVSAVGFVANLVAIPLYSLAIVPLNLLAAVADALSVTAAGALWLVADRLLQLVQTYLQWLAEPSWAALSMTGGLRWWSVMLALLGAAVALLPRPVPARWLALCLMSPLLLPRPAAAPPEGRLWLTVLDVGQGLAVVAQTANHSLVYDVGPRFSDRFDTATAVVLPYLEHRGVERVDRLVISHADNDHAGAVGPFLAGIDTGDVSVGQPLASDAAQSRCRRGQRWQWDGVTFEYLHPGGGEGPQSNDRSCVLLIGTGEQRVLLSGDIGRGVERELLPRLTGAAPLALLIAPHHGSLSSSGTPFVRTTRPRHVVFSAGHKHQFGHPHPQVVARYRRVGSRLWNTAAHGALRFRISPAGIEALPPWREVRRRYWD